MSDNISKCDWFKHLHVQAALWEEKGLHTRSQSTRGCMCKKSCIDGIKHCLSRRLNWCKFYNLVPKEYEGEVDTFFEFLKHEKFNSKRITKLVQRRNCLVCLLDFLVSYDRLCDLERQQVINKFETQNIKSHLESVHTLDAVLTSTPNTRSSESPESFTKEESTFNDTTWLRHMYRLCLKMSNKVEGRVKWQKVNNGVDPNNVHTNPFTGKKQEFTRRENLILELRSLAPQWLQPFSCPRPYREEVQLLLAFLEEGGLDKKTIQLEQKLRKLAIGLNDVLLTVLKMGNVLNEITKNIEPSRRGQLLTCLTDLGHRLKVLSQNTDESRAFSEDKQTSDQSNHDHETNRRKNPSADDISYAADQVTGKKMNVSNPKATLNGSKEEMIDFDNSEPSCSHENTYDYSVPGEGVAEDTLSFVLGLLSDSVPMQHCLDLEQEVSHHPLISDDISNQSFHQLLDAAKSMITLPHDDCLDIDSTREHQLSRDNMSGQDDITVSIPEREDYTRMADLTQSSPTDTFTWNKSYAASDLTLSEAMENVSQSQSPSAIDFTEVDPSNQDAVLELWFGLGDDVINLMNGSELRKFGEKMKVLDTRLRKRLQQTALQSEGSGGVSVTDSGSSNSVPAILSSEVEPDGSRLQSSQATPVSGKSEEKGRKRKRSDVDVDD